MAEDEKKFIAHLLKKFCTVKAAYLEYRRVAVRGKFGLRSLSAFRRYVTQVLKYSFKMVYHSNTSKSISMCLDRYYLLCTAPFCFHMLFVSCL